LGVFLAGRIVAVLAHCVIEMITTCSPMIVQFFDTMTVASTDEELL